MSALLEAGRVIGGLWPGAGVVLTSTDVPDHMQRRKGVVREAAGDVAAVAFELCEVVAIVELRKLSLILPGRYGRDANLLLQSAIHERLNGEVFETAPDWLRVALGRELLKGRAHHGMLHGPRHRLEGITDPMKALEACWRAECAR